MTILGIDISKWDGNWDAAKAKQAGATFAFIKASQATFTDPLFLTNWQKAKDAGLIRGAYHYLDYTKSGIDQANYFADLLKNDPGELPPVIDYELRRTDNNPSAALGFLRDCLDQIMKRSELFQNANSKRPMIYTGPGFWAEYGDLTKSDYWIQFPLWNAHWTTSATPIVPPPWSMWQFWQFTSKGPGEAYGSECLTMDMNRFNGTLDELLEFAGIRNPVLNPNELLDTLNGKITKLEGMVAAINQAVDPSSGISSRVDNLEGQVSNIGGSITSLTATLSQRIADVEKRIANLETVPSLQPVPVPLPANLPVQTAPASTSTVPVPSPSDPAVDVMFPSSSLVPATPLINSPVDVNPASDPSVPVTTPSDMPVEYIPSLEPSAPTEPISGQVIYATCTTSALNVRSGPGASFPMVAGLRYGQIVKVINRQNGWAQFDKPSGWSSEVYLSFAQSDPSDPNATPQILANPNSFGICNTSGLNVRGGPGATYPIVAGLTFGQRTRILGHKNGWAQIESPSGWCNATYLSFA
jgi:lysozyme